MTDPLEQVVQARQRVRAAAAQHADSVEAFLDDKGEDDVQRLSETKRAVEAGQLTHADYAEAVESYLADPRLEAVEETKRRLQDARDEYGVAVEAFLRS